MWKMNLWLLSLGGFPGFKSSTYLENSWGMFGTSLWWRWRGVKMRARRLWRGMLIGRVIPLSFPFCCPNPVFAAMLKTDAQSTGHPVLFVLFVKNEHYFTISKLWIPWESFGKTLWFSPSLPEKSIVFSHSLSDCIGLALRHLPVDGSRVSLFPCIFLLTSHSYNHRPWQQLFPPLPAK